MTTPAQRFQPGDRVRVRKVDAPGHIRTPWYIRGQEGVIERFCGHFKNPEELAYFRPGTPDYAGPAQDTLDIDIYDHWLEPAAAPATTEAART
jgi:nitrile hydratase